MNLGMAMYAVNSHRDGKNPIMSRDFYEAVKEIAKNEEGLCPEDRTSHVLQSSKDYDLTPEMDDTRFTLGRSVNEYFSKFGHKGIRFLNLLTDDLAKDECIVNYLWFYSPDFDSDLNARDRSLNDDYDAFGVLRGTCEASSQNSGYSLTDVKKSIVNTTPKSLEALGLSGVKDIVAGRLEKDVLEALRKK